MGAWHAEDEKRMATAIVVYSKAGVPLSLQSEDARKRQNISHFCFDASSFLHRRLSRTSFIYEISSKESC